MLAKSRFSHWPVNFRKKNNLKRPSNRRDDQYRRWSGGVPVLEC